MQDKQTLSDRKKQDIVNAAIQEFDSHGFQKTSMDQIAKTANVSKRTVYNHFPSKDALFVEITSIMWEQALTATVYPYQKTLTLKEQLTTIADQEMQLLKSPTFISVSRLIIAECLHSENTKQQTLAHIADAESGLNIWLKHATEDGRLAIDDIDIAATQFSSLLKSFAYWPQIIGFGDFPEPAKYKHIIDSAVEMFLTQYQVQS
ncbi:TetR/AcrR family transcriptional regulator [Paraglaciecola arctica]|uniref:TetR/AcrR family transcriptional regulator n=1 Tax=Paraglaciecola arctica TaxID=1128911 RepID=UPI001C06E369|nr:TetR/AcrR family transcriptional regulator [Paraglaciecola arctica]MBU3002406.1 TetR/AcrR family transcriptional regulator [Paraglaciecola arctica]